MTWHVVCDPNATNPKPGDPIWTVSRDPKRTGWETDSGYWGYGLTLNEAMVLASSANTCEAICARKRAGKEFFLVTGCDAYGNDILEVI